MTRETTGRSEHKGLKPELRVYVRDRLERTIGPRAAEAVDRLERSVALYWEIPLVHKPTLRAKAELARKTLTRTRHLAMNSLDPDLLTQILLLMFSRGDLGPLPSWEEVTAYYQRKVEDGTAPPDTVPCLTAAPQMLFVPLALGMAMERRQLVKPLGHEKILSAIVEIEALTTQIGRPADARSALIAGRIAHILDLEGVPVTEGSEQTPSVYEDVTRVFLASLTKEDPGDVGRICAPWVKRTREKYENRP